MIPPTQRLAGVAPALAALAEFGALQPSQARAVVLALCSAATIDPASLAPGATEALQRRLNESDRESAALKERAEVAEVRAEEMAQQIARLRGQLDAATLPAGALGVGTVAIVAADAAADAEIAGLEECEQPAEEIPAPVVDYLQELDPQLREAFEDLHDLACEMGFQPEAEITGLDCPEHELGALGVTLRILGLLIFLWKSGALGLIAGAAAPNDSAAEGDRAAATSPPSSSEAPEAAPPIAVEQPQAGPAHTPFAAGVATASGEPTDLAAPSEATSSEPNEGQAAPAISPPTLAPERPAAPRPEPEGPLHPLDSSDRLLAATSAEPGDLAALDPDDLEEIEPLPLGADEAPEPIQGDVAAGWALLGQALGADGLDVGWLTENLTTQQDAADVLAALDYHDLPLTGPDIGALDDHDRQDAIKVAAEILARSAAWGMVWGPAGDGYVVARPWVYLSATEEARDAYTHRIPVEDWPDARLAWVDLEAAVGVLTQERRVLLDAIYLDQEASPPELRPARTGRGNLGAHVSQLGTAEVCALARLEAPGLTGLGSPAGWAALYSDDERVRIAYQRVKGHRDHLAIQRRANTEPETPRRGGLLGWLGMD
jgi:hypothetical protein